LGVWSSRVVPELVHRVMQRPRFLPWRRRLVAEARGEVLEIGVGSGLNLPLYGRRVRRLVGVDPSTALLARARRAAEWVNLPVELHETGAETLPFADARFDTVVSSWTLCSVGDLARVLAEIRRVLRPEGTFLFLEHGRAPDPALARWQRRLTPLWRRLAGGCRLDRDVPAALRAAGFRVETVEAGHLIRGPRLLTWHWFGRARPADGPADATTDPEAGSGTAR